MRRFLGSIELNRERTVILSMLRTLLVLAATWLSQGPDVGMQPLGDGSSTLHKSDDQALVKGRDGGRKKGDEDREEDTRLRLA